MRRRIFCYVDETGQDAGAKFFIVSVLLFEKDRDLAIQQCEEAEEVSGKGSLKWIKTSYDRRITYIEAILKAERLKDRLFFKSFEKPNNFEKSTIKTISQCINVIMQSSDYKANIYIDGLPVSTWGRFGQSLRSSGIKIKKIRGIRKEENDALTRLADAVCGLVRGSIEGQEKMMDLFEKAKRRGFLTEL
jgi:hypothetical protein